jgi:hypothetical protein
MYVRLSLESSFCIDSPAFSKKKNYNFYFILCVKNAFLNILPFYRHFFAKAVTAATKNILATVFIF